MRIPEIQYTHYNTRVCKYLDLNKYLLKILANDISRERIKRDLPHCRTTKSYYRELLAHKRMYKLHLFRKHTIDCDLEEHIKLCKEIIYFIFSV